MPYSPIQNLKKTKVSDRVFKAFLTGVELSQLELLHIE